MTTIQPITVAAPPFAALYLSGLPAGTARVEAWRRWRGVSERVRGDGQVVVLGGEASLIDWGLPVATSTVELVTYTVHAYDTNGTLLDDSGSVAIPPVTIGHSEAWICDPHDPMASELVGLYDTGGDETSEAAIEELVTLLGLPIGRGQARQRRQRTWRIGSVRPLAVDAILGTGTATGGTGTWSVMVRADPDCITHPTGVLHVTAPTVARHQLRPHDPDTRWTWTGTETRGPQAPPAVARRTYADDLEETPTYADSLAMYPTYRDRIRAGL